MINHGLILDGLGSTQDALYFLIPKADLGKECLTPLIKGLTHNNPRILTCFSLLPP